MPADKRRAPRKETTSRSRSGPDRAGKDSQSSRHADGVTAAMDERLAARTAVFGVLVVILAGVAIWFVHSTLQRGGLNNNVTLTANARHTVKVGDVPAEEHATALEMLDNAVLLSVVGGHKLFLHDMANGRLALCVGSFSSSDSPGARDLLEHLTAYELDGQRVFRSAVIWSYQPQAGQ